MNTKASFFKKGLYVFVLLVLIVVAVIKLKKNKAITQSKVYQYNKEEAIHVEADTLRIENVNVNYSYSGTFEANKETKVSAEIQGKINAVLVDVGNVVRKGEPVIQLDNSLLNLQLQAVELQIQGLEADANRYTILAKADAIQGVQLEKTLLGLKSANVQKATILEQLNKTLIKAPFDGVITAKLIEEGAFAAPGVPLLQITDITILKFTIYIAENDLDNFQLNRNYSIVTDAYSDLHLIGKIGMIGSKANLASRFPIQFTVVNTTDLKVKSGMFGTANLMTDTQIKSIVIPSSAIVGSSNQPQVYLIKNGKAILQNITVLKSIQNKIVVEKGLKEGDVIVSNGFINLFDGANVTFN